MKKSLWFLWCIITAWQGSAQDTAFVREVLRKWDNAITYTREVADAMPMDQFGFRPIAEEMSFDAQLEHMAKNMTWLAGDYLSGTPFEHPLLEKEDRTPAETMQLLNAALDFARDAIANTDPGTLSDEKDFFAGPMSKRQIILLMHDHHTHHRGQLIVYLRLNGIKPPRYRGW